VKPALPLEKIAARAFSLGASLVGAAHVVTLLASPSHRRFPIDRRVQESRSVLVLALAHDDAKPEMDWWDNRQGRTPGNRRLIKINRKLAKWFRKTYAVEASELPYHAHQRGVFLKDAAVLAGLGVVGKNNLLVTPQYGPRVRLRALLLDRYIACTGPLAGFSPCDTCEGFCMRACPKEAFAGGAYRHDRCRQQMEKNESEPVVLASPVVGMPTRFKIAYCRLCELACPVGR
jgi:epoxyqueuosine reductase